MVDGVLVCFLCVTVDDIVISGPSAEFVLSRLEESFTLTVERLEPGSKTDYIGQIVTRSPEDENKKKLKRWLTLDQCAYIESIDWPELSQFDDDGELKEGIVPTKIGNRSAKLKATNLWQYLRSFLGKIMYTL